jgi:hypothetical protein
MKEVLPWLVRWACRAGTCYGCSGQPSTQYFFAAILYFNLCVPIAQQLGQAVGQGRLSLNMCLRPRLEDETGFGVGLSYRPASLCCFAGRYDNPDAINLQKWQKNILF